MRTHAKDSQPVAQAELWHDDISDALRGLVSACGGAKAIGQRMFPEQSPDAAARSLLDRLNPDRPHTLTPAQFLLLLKIGRDAGYHGAMHYLADEIGYTRPAPIDPEDARAELQRQFIDAVNRAEALGKRLAK